MPVPIPIRIGGITNGVTIADHWSISNLEVRRSSLSNVKPIPNNDSMESVDSTGPGLYRISLSTAPAELDAAGNLQGMVDILDDFVGKDVAAGFANGVTAVDGVHVQDFRAQYVRGRGKPGSLATLRFDRVSFKIDLIVLGEVVENTSGGTG